MLAKIYFGRGDEGGDAVPPFFVPPFSTIQPPLPEEHWDLVNPGKVKWELQCLEFSDS